MGRFAFFALMCLQFCQAYAENWVSVFQVAHEGRVHVELVDADSVVREGSIITFWSMNKGGVHDDLANSKTADGQKLGHLQIQRRLDCLGMSETETLQRKRVDLETGRLIHEWQMSAEYLEKSRKYYLPGTEGFSKAKAICALDAPKPTPPAPKREPPALKV